MEEWLIVAWPVSPVLHQRLQVQWMVADELVNFMLIPKLSLQKFQKAEKDRAKVVNFYSNDAEIRASGFRFLQNKVYHYRNAREKL